MSEAVTATVVGTCDTRPEHTESGWTKFEVTVPGKQYPVRVDTKIDAIINEAEAAFKDGIERAWTYKETNGNPNPNKPGTFYKNRLLQKVEAVTEEHRRTADTQISSKAAGRGWQPRSDEEQDLIVRQVALKAAVEYVNAYEGPTEDQIKRLALAEEYAEFVWKQTNRNGAPTTPDKEIPGGTAAGVPEGFNESIPFTYVP